MTPMLVLLFNINPSAAISSDVVASFVLKPIGGGVHIRKGTVNWRLVRWLSLGSVPCAFTGAYVISHIGGDDFEDRIKRILGTVLLVAACAMVVKLWVSAHRRTAAVDEMMDPALVRPIPTLVVGAVGGFIVGMTSVDSGSLMIVSLMVMYPRLSSREMVGTDLVQAIPLVGAAAAGHLLFGHMELGLTGSVLLGAMPGVYLGAHVSSRANDRYIRPVLVAVLLISSLKLLGASNAVLLAAIISIVLVAGAVVVVALSRRRRAEARNVAPAR